MTSTALRRARTTALLAAIAAGLALSATPVAGAETTATNSAVRAAAHRTWACTVPPTYTWSAVRINTNCGFRYEYYLLDPVNYNLTGTYACYIPSGYTYTASRQGSNCSTSGSSYEYRLAKV